VEEKRKMLIEGVRKAGGSSPLLVNIVANRIKQLDRGAAPLIENIQGLNVSDIALREFVEGKIGYRPRVLPE
jgi:hypothetical protein